MGVFGNGMVLIVGAETSFELKIKIKEAKKAKKRFRPLKIHTLMRKMCFL